jgi:hypothetical protein
MSRARTPVVAGGSAEARSLRFGREGATGRRSSTHRSRFRRRQPADRTRCRGPLSRRRAPEPTTVTELSAVPRGSAHAVRSAHWKTAPALALLGTARAHSAAARARAQIDACGVIATVR